MTILNLGRIGDNINLLPVLYSEHLAGRRPTIVTSGKYAEIFEAVSYCDVRRYSGDPIHLGHALSLCQVNQLRDLRVAQVFLHEDKRQLEKSYAHESYRLGNFRDRWRRYPYVFDRRDREREEKLIENISQPFIAVAPHGVSSPFAHNEQLINGLQSRFPEYKILDLSKIQGERIYDLLGIMDRASCLVTVDTAHLWLSNASKCPVVALINDGWRGSPPSTTTVATFRYGDYHTNQVCDELEKTLLPTGDIWGIVNRFGKEKRHQEAFKSQKLAFDHILGCDNLPRTAQAIGNERPLPMLREMMGKALKFASGRDIIVWTNDDVEIRDLGPVINHVRRFGAVGVRRDPTHTGRELFAFRWDWLADRFYNFPDCVTASPWFDLVVAAWIRRQFGWVSTMDNLLQDRYPAEIPNENILFHPDHESSWKKSMKDPASLWNERILKIML
jgi:hypothetical protein